MQPWGTPHQSARTTKMGRSGRYSRPSFSVLRMRATISASGAPSSFSMLPTCDSAERRQAPQQAIKRRHNAQQQPPSIKTPSTPNTPTRNWSTTCHSTSVRHTHAATTAVRHSNSNTTTMATATHRNAKRCRRIALHSVPGATVGRSSRRWIRQLHRLQLFRCCCRCGGGARCLALCSPQHL